MRYLILIKTIKINSVYIPKGTIMLEKQWISVIGRNDTIDLKHGTDSKFFKLYEKKITLLEKVKFLQDEISDLMDEYFKNKQYEN